MANKETVFECEIKDIKSPKESKLDDQFAKNLGAKDLSDLTAKIKSQITSQYMMALNSITKKEILDQLEKNHKLEIPKNLIDREIDYLSKNSKEKPESKKIKTIEKKIKTWFNFE